METLTQTQEIAIKTNGISHWLIVDDVEIKISRKDYFDFLTASDNEIDIMLSPRTRGLMTGQNAPQEAK